MDAEVDIAICLRQWDFSETSQTAALFCRRLGIVRVLGKGTKRADPRFSGGLEVCTQGEAVVVPKASGGLATLAGWDLRETYRNCRVDLASYYAAMFAIDVVHNLLPEGEPHPLTFDALDACLGSLEGPTWQRVLVELLWSVLRDAGFRPRVDMSRSGPAAFLPAEGALVRESDAPVHATAWAVHPDTAAGLMVLDAESDPDLLSPVDAERVGRLLAWYVREIIERELSTLRPVYGDTPPRPSNPHH